MCSSEDLCQPVKQLPETHCRKKGPSCHPDLGTSMAWGGRAGVSGQCSVSGLHRVQTCHALLLETSMRRGLMFSLDRLDTDILKG